MTRPTRYSSSPRSANVASSTARLVGGQRDEQPAGRLGIVGERLRAQRRPRSRRAARRTRGCAGRRPCAPRPRRARARRAARGARRHRARSAPRCATPSRGHGPSSPKPVTSVTAFGANGRSASAASRLSVRIAATAASSAPSGARPSRCAWSTRPVPSGFVRKSASPGRAPLFGQMPSGWTVPTTARPYFGSSSRIVWPPARIAPGGAHDLVRSREDLPEHLRRQLLRESGDREREQRLRRPSRRRRSARSSPRSRRTSRGSSTTGGKKSTVKTSARSSSSRYTAASSAGSSPTSRSADSTGTKPASSVSSRAAEYFAAHPPAFASEVSVGVSVTKRVYARPAWWRRARLRRVTSPLSSATNATTPWRPSLVLCEDRIVPSALVTGGSSGIGLAIAQMLGEEGYALTLAGRKLERLQAARDGLGVDAAIVAADVCSRGGLQPARRRARRSPRRVRRARQLGGGRNRRPDRRHDDESLGSPAERQPARRLPRHARRPSSPPQRRGGYVVNLASIAGTHADARRSPPTARRRRH